MDGNWVEFDERQQRITSEHYVTLNSRGEFMINSALYEAMDHPEAVTLHYDTDHDRIGLQKADKRLPNAFQVRKRTDRGGYTVRSRRFLTKWDIRLTGTYSFPDSRIEEGMLILPLTTRFNVSKKRR
jgi:hypothetical protein